MRISRDSANIMYDRGTSGTYVYQATADQNIFDTSEDYFDQRIVATLPAPWSMTFLPDGRLLVTERPAAGPAVLNPTAEGHIRIVTQTGEISAPISGLPSNIGILDIELDPNFSENHIVYFSYLERDPSAPRIGRASEITGIDPVGLSVARGVLDMDGPDGPTLTFTSVIWRQEPKIVSHPGSGEPGGRLSFSPDGSYLFITAGDRQEFDPVQALDNTLGKIIRIYPDGTIPSDNPFVGVPGVPPEVWSLGHRNPYGLVFTPSGDLWENEMGPMGGDELNVIQGAANYGWPYVSYGDNYDGSPIPRPGEGDGYAEAALWWTPVIAPSGMIYYSSSAFPQWQGDLIISGLQSGGLVVVDIDGTSAVEETRIDLGGRTRDVVQGPDGSLWILYDQPDGRLVQLSPNQPGPPGSSEPPATIISAPLKMHDLAFAALSTGQFVAVWSDEVEGGGSGVRAQIYNAGGLPVGPEILVNQTTSGNQGGPSVSATADGGFVVTYGIRTDGDFNIYVQLFQADGIATGSPILVNNDAASFHSPPTISVLSDGSFAVTWLATNSSNNTDVRVQYFTSDGVKVGEESIVSDQPETGKIGENIVALAGGGFVISWTDYGHEADSYGNTNTGVRAQIFDALGNKVGSTIIVNTVTAADQDFSSLAALPDGGFVVTWRDDGYAYGGSTGSQGIWAQLIDSSGAKIGNAIHVTGSGEYGFAPTITILPGIGFAVVWQDTSVAAGAARNIEARLFDFGGQPLGPAFSTELNGNATQSFPAAAGAENGALFIGWTNVDRSTPLQVDEHTTSFQVAIGSTADDLFNGSGARDLYFGGTGNDTISGGSGSDILTGGLGADLFSGTSAELNSDTITDFSTADRIVIIDVDAADFAFSISGNTLTYSGGSLTLGSIPSGQIVARPAVTGGVELVAVPSSAPIYSGTDVNGDGRDDILWRNDNGTFGNWLGMANGGFLINDAGLVTISTTWQIAGSGDFNGDGRDDVLWRNDDGALGNWLGLADGGYLINDGDALAHISTDWNVVGTGDFNGDGRDDILWRNDDGTLGNWLGLADGGYFINDGALAHISADWNVVGVGDFNGDGHDDILWRNDNGVLGDWLGLANGGYSINDTELTHVSIDWNVVGVGDFNGDGLDDILWRSVDGTVGNWLSSADGEYLINDGGSLISVSTEWNVAGIGDFNGDGRDDILWQNDNGSLTDWLGTPNGGFAGNDDAAFHNISIDWTPQPTEFLYI